MDRRCLMSLLVQYFWAIFALLVGKEMICVFGKKWMAGRRRRRMCRTERERERER